MLMDKHYEIFFANGSQVVVKDTEKEAVEYAEWLSMNNIDTDIVVTEVTEIVIKKFRNGGEVA